MNGTRAIVCDLDNTLYDWVAFFVPSFYAMVDEAVSILNCDRENLLDDLRLVHQKYHDSEHPFALLETRTVSNLLAAHNLDDRRQILDPAFKAFNSTRKQHLRLYPGVKDTLARLKNDGTKLIAHSESRIYSVMFRMRFLELTDLFEKIYCLERPSKTMVQTERAQSFWREFPTEKIVEVKHHQRKPNPDILLEILSDVGTHLADAAYIGDSLTKDVLMAKQAGCLSVWARYGTYHDDALYQKLVRISHWTVEEVRRETELKALVANVKPDYVATESFAEILGFLERGTTLSANWART